MQSNNIDIDVILVIIAIAIELAVLAALMFGVFASNRKKDSINLIQTKVELPLNLSTEDKKDAISKLKQSLLTLLEANNVIKIAEVDAKNSNLKTITASISVK